MTSGCVLGANPDRRCSPDAYSKLSKAVIYDKAKFKTPMVRYVTDKTKQDVENEYGLNPRPAKPYGNTLEIDHIVSLELGGSNDIATVYPETADAHPCYHVKDKLHELVCHGKMTLRTAQRRIGTNWQASTRACSG